MECVGKVVEDSKLAAPPLFIISKLILEQSGERWEDGFLIRHIPQSYTDKPSEAFIIALSTVQEQIPQY